MFSLTDQVVARSQDLPRGEDKPSYWRASISATVAIVFGAICAHAEAKITLSAGHVIGSRGATITSALMKAISDRLPDVEVYYDTSTTDSGSGKDRFKKRSQLADIVCIYVGSTDVLDELTGLIREGRLQPVDALPGYKELIRPEDIYPNVLEPVTLEGHVWAVPVRICPPLIVTVPEITSPMTTWDGFFRACAEATFSPSDPSDYYALWLTLLNQRGASIVADGKYDFSGPLCKQFFNAVHTVFSKASKRTDPVGAICLANADSLADFPRLQNEMRPYPVPTAGNGKIYCSAWGWYLGVNTQVAGPPRRAVVQALAALLSPEIQLEIARSSSAPPVRPSVAQSSQFASLFPPESNVAILRDTTRRLTFRAGGPISAAGETIVESAFNEALKRPEEFVALMDEAAVKANSLIAAGAKGPQR